jgi:outer membrane phospholipase A
LLLFTTPLFAQSFLALDTIDYQSGDAVVFSLYPSTTERSNELLCRLTAMESDISIDVTASTIANDKQTDADRYRLTLPKRLSGPVKLTIPDLLTAPVLLMVRTEATGAEEYPTFASLFTLYQPYIVNISAYKPIYFMIGTDPEKSTFQFSFKYRLFNPYGSLNKSLPWLQGVHIGFTQTSFWDLKSESLPFEDTSYKPELFFLSDNSTLRPNSVDGLFFQLGYQHESNGRSGDDSRSTNFLYLKNYWIFYNERSKIGLMIAPKVWTYIANDNETNRSLNTYRGYFELDTKVGKADGLVLGARLGWAAKGGSIHADVSYPISSLLSDNLSVYLHLQYVDALSESLIDYQSRTRAVRIGISFVR